jgi:hypothetical protein
LVEEEVVVVVVAEEEPAVELFFLEDAFLLEGVGGAGLEVDLCLCTH